MRISQTDARGSAIRQPDAAFRASLPCYPGPVPFLTMTRRPPQPAGHAASAPGGEGRGETRPASRGRGDDPRGAQAGFPSHPPVGTGSRPVPELRAGKGRVAALLAYWPRGPGRWRVSAEGPGSPPARGPGEGTLSRPLSGSAINFLVSLPI